MSQTAHLTCSRVVAFERVSASWSSAGRWTSFLQLSSGEGGLAGFVDVERHTPRSSFLPTNPVLMFHSIHAHLIRVHRVDLLGGVEHILGRP